jgi:hypothetical protein
MGKKAKSRAPRKPKARGKPKPVARAKRTPMDKRKPTTGENWERPLTSAPTSTEREVDSLFDPKRRVSNRSA